MQSLQDFSANSKRRLELQNQYNTQLQQQQQNCDDMICDNEEPPFKKQRPGVAASLIYKFVELATYTSAIASDTINTIAGVQGARGGTRQAYECDDVLQVGTDDEDDEENDLYGHNLDKKVESAWSENVDDEEPPPPYDSSWSMPSPSTHDKLSTTPAFSSSTSQEEIIFSQQPTTSQQITTKSTTNRRRQFRVRRGRRIVRRKSSSVDMTSGANSSNTTSSTQPENDVEDVFLKFNCKLADMIAEGKAALNSKVDVTDVEMMLAEEKDREERIMKELGIQTPINRRARRLTNSSSSSDYDYYNSLIGSSGSHSNQINTPLPNNGLYNGGSNFCSSPTSYSVDNGFSRPAIGRSSHGSHGGFNSFSGSSNGYGYGHGYSYGSPSTGSPTTPSSGGYLNSSGYGSNSGLGPSWMCNSNSRSYY